ncbi:jg1858 [Pararge aegeria aegeria]|uniref:Jg1858 protein n=1 Tax=Pararge aegeria aegeria TaxID=348720 RepID=A0A8S4R080_9NEOP|nr:jg1858 [Pararge aegeria aegeria]
MLLSGRNEHGDSTSEKLSQTANTKNGVSVKPSGMNRAILKQGTQGARPVSTLCPAEVVKPHVVDINNHDSNAVVQ